MLETRSRTLAVGSAEGDYGSGIARGASLVGAITNTIAKVGVGAVAGSVADIATKLLGRNVDHVVDAGLLRDTH